MKKTQRNSQVVSYVIKFHINFSFGFLGLDNVDFENYFANKLINISRFFKALVVVLYQI